VARELAQLRAEYQPRLRRALARDMQPVAERLADYLLVAREAFRAGYAAPVQRHRLSLVARTNNLNEAVLNAWVAHLAAATKDAGDPLYPWARTGSESSSDPKQLAKLIRNVAPGQAKPAPARKGAEVVIDYARAQPAQWIADGYTFGIGPVRPGEVRVAAAGPSVQFIERGAAEQDSAWHGLKLAPGTENDQGALGAVVRSGRTICTPTFTIRPGKVFYLVKGTGQAYASVGAHVMIAGPLHGRLVLPLRAGPCFRWVCHDLTAYKGQPAHVEFTATTDSGFAIAMVVQADRVPPSIDRPNRLVADALNRGNTGSLKLLAHAYQDLFSDLARRLPSEAFGPDRACLANWVLRHASLFGCGPEGGKALANEVKAILAGEAKLTARIQKESRLALAMLDGTGQEGHVLVRGSPKVLGEAVPRRFLEALAGPAGMAIAQGSGRLELARAITDPARNPLFARVIVNRIWHHLFGRGIVPSVDNFGVLGERPTHPELLDYLADHFVKDGWSVKQMIRRLVLSSTYRMGCRADARADAADPTNRLFHRMPVRRLEGEAIRDAMLAVSGRLNRAMYGPAVPVHLTPFLVGRGRPASGPLNGAGRRSVYLAVRRNFLSPFLLAFDTPIPFSTMGRRTVSNVPAQALILMNDPFVHQQADLWAKRMLARPGTPRQRIAAMYEVAFGRLPTATEAAACLDFLDYQARHGPAGGGDNTPATDDHAAWADLAHVLFNAKEFIFLN
jgi:hypothetical protein